MSLFDKYLELIPDPTVPVPYWEPSFIDLPGWAIPWIIGLTPYLVVFLYMLYRMFVQTDENSTVHTGV